MLAVGIRGFKDKENPELSMKPAIAIYDTFA